MLKIVNPLLQLKLTTEKSFLLQTLKNIYESLFEIFDLILENSIENIWYEYFNIIIGYFQLINFIFDRTVSYFTFFNSHFI